MIDVLRDLTRPCLLVLIGATSVASVPAADRFVKPSGAGAACTQASPCALPTALGTAADGDRIYVGAGTYTGTGSEVALVDRAVHLLGGWNGAASGDVARDPIANGSVLDGQQARRGVKIVASGAVLDGFTVANGNATGQNADCGGGNRDGCGGGILVTASGVTIANNLIRDNVAATTPAADQQVIAYGGGIKGYHATTSSSRPTPSRATSRTPGTPAAAAGSTSTPATAPRVARNRIVDNTATTYAGDHGWGGGIALAGPTPRSSTTSCAGTARTPSALTTATRSTPGTAPASCARTASTATTRAAPCSSAASRGQPPTTASRSSATSRRWRSSTRLRRADRADQQHPRGRQQHGRARARQGLLGVPGERHAPAQHHRRRRRHDGGVRRRLRRGDDDEQPPRRPRHAAAVDGRRHHHRRPHPLLGRPGRHRAGTDAIFGNPNFVNPAVGDFHIHEGSAARGTGIPAGVTADFEGDPRPAAATRTSAPTRSAPAPSTSEPPPRR